MIFHIRLADRIIEIQSLYDKIYSFCRRYLMSSQVQLPSDIVIKSSQEDIEKEAHITRQMNRKRAFASDTLLHPEDLEITAVYRKIAASMLQYDTLLMHGALMASGGYGYMIAAPSGVGKTTRAILWHHAIPGSIVVNGDKPLVRVQENSVYAFGTPWSGKEKWNRNMSVPLQAVFLLEQALPGEDTLVEEIDMIDALWFLIRQTYQIDGPALTPQIIRLLRYMSGKIKIYRFRSEPSEEAVIYAYETARPR